MKKDIIYDLIVIGGGAAGLNTAVFAGEVGLHTLLINKSEATMGGDCTHFGCVPSKSLLHVAQLFADSKRAKEFGLRVAGQADWRAVKKHISTTIQSFHKQEDEKALLKYNIHAVFGHASFSGKRTVKVGDKFYTAKRFVIATGAKPIIPDIPGIEQANVVTNEQIFTLQSLPKRLTIMGGGPIGCELAQGFARLGSKVTILNKGKRLLEREEQQISSLLEEKLLSEGITILHNAEVEKFPTRTSLEYTHKGKSHTLISDVTLCSIGRQANTAELNLEAAGVKVTSRGAVVTDTHLRTTNKRIYASGDVIGQYQFTHATELHGRIILNNLFSPLKKKIDYKNFSWVTFTDPEIAHFGYTKKDLEEKNISYVEHSIDLSEVDRLRTDKYEKGLYKQYLTKSGKLLGGYIMSRGAGEYIQELLTAKLAGKGQTFFVNKIYAYPVASRMHQWSAFMYAQKKFSKLQKKLLKTVFKILN